MKNKQFGRFLFKILLVSAVVVMTTDLFFSSALAEGQKENKIRILGTVPLTGPASMYGQGYQKGIMLAIKELEAEGIKGFDGIEYRVVDTETKPSLVDRKLAREVPSFKPHFIVGVGTESELKVWNVQLPKYKIPGLVGGHLGLNKHMGEGAVPVSKWVMYYGYADYFTGLLAGEFFHKKGVKRVAFVGSDFDWGYSNGMGLKRYWQDNGQPFEIVAVVYTPLDKTDYSTEVQILKDAKPDAIFSVFGGAGWWTLSKQLREGGVVPNIFLYGAGYSNMGSAKLTGEFGAEGVYAFHDHDPTSKAWIDFIKRWRAEYGEQSYPEPYSNNMYEQIYWAVKALEKVGPDRIDDKEFVADTLLNFSYQGILISPTGPLSPDGANWGSKAALVQYVKGAGPLDPSFGLHPELIEVLTTPKKSIHDVLGEMGTMTRLEPGESYPMKP
ncbi:MAG: ABC transporter substrate-binding protein [Spirochaetes bacterium]|nr:ABC transporter substrate-binding protein [Spirochaetota bacterium]